MGNKVSGTIMAKEEDLAKDLKDQTVIVTGGNSGIGLQTVEQLVKQGATVVLCCRKLESGEPLASKLTELHPGTVKAMKLDLADLSSVREFATKFKEENASLKILVNNAGVMNTPQQKTKDGFEMQFGTNHLGHFLLTELLIDTMKKSAPARIVCLSSCAHDHLNGGIGEINFDDLMFEKRKYDGWAAYCQSKLANVLHAKELAKRYGKDGISAASVHPGFVRSNLLKHTIPSFLKKPANAFLSYFSGMIEPWEGTQASLHAILSDEVAEKYNGCFFSQGYSPKDMYRDETKNCGGFPIEPPPNPAVDEATASKLWDVSYDLVGLKGFVSGVF